jgi:diguanylate cyclase (GGDEF)-like protein/PAS domain S-box-containing protein
LALAATVIESTLEGILVTDPKGRILSVNSSFVRMFGYPLAEIQGLALDCLGAGDGDGVMRLSHVIEQADHWQGELVLRRQDGTDLPVWLNANTVREQGRIRHHVAAFTELTALKLSEQRLRYLAYHDVLTGLPNRALFQDRLQQLVAQADRNQWQVAVLFIDLDRFKFINDTLGHQFGDLLLRTVANRIGLAIREADTAARIGGDEFAVLLPNLHHGAADAERVAAKILCSLAEPYDLAEHEVFVTASIGIALHGPGSPHSTTLVEKADLAMYRAKELGKNRYASYTQDLDLAAAEQLRMETALRHALDNGEFSLVYQPQVGARSGEVVGVEALLRWVHPEWGSVGAGEFIPFLEETGLIVPVGAWVVRTACSQAVAWREQGLRPIRMAINISNRQLIDPEFVAMMALILQETGIAPALVEIEITEHVIMGLSERMREVLTAVKALGLGIAVDNFGSGTTSLRFLQDFPVDSLKICNSLVLDVGENSHGAAIVTALLGLAANMRMTSIVEGVEQESQSTALQHWQCDEMQGFLFSRPLPAGAIAALLDPAAPSLISAPREAVG